LNIRQGLLLLLVVSTSNIAHSFIHSFIQDIISIKNLMNPQYLQKPLI